MPAIRRTLSLDAIVGPYLQGQWPKEAEGTTVTCANDKATQVSAHASRFNCRRCRSLFCSRRLGLAPQVSGGPSSMLWSEGSRVEMAVFVLLL